MCVWISQQRIHYGGLEIINTLWFNATKDDMYLNTIIHSVYMCEGIPLIE